MFRIGCFFIGYLFGNILTAEIIARLRFKKSAFEIGSGNPGTANITKQIGLAAGAAVLAGDLLKVVAACILCGYIFFAPEPSEPALTGILTSRLLSFGASGPVIAGRPIAGAVSYLLSFGPGPVLLRFAWAGLGCTVGHNMPFWHRFNGGKGVATTCASLFLISPLWGTAAMLIGLAGVKIKKSLALGGILIPAVFLPFAAALLGMEVTAVTLVLTAFMIWRFMRTKNASQ